MAWAFRLLPIVIIGVITFTQRARLRQPLAYLLFGVLTFYGVAWVVSQFAWNWRLNLMTSTVGDELAVAVLSSALLQFAVAMVMGAGPLMWLFRLLAGERVHA
jgi:hypothetical protein